MITDAMIAQYLASSKEGCRCVGDQPPARGEVLQLVPGLVSFWMTEQEAARYRISETAQIGLEAILSLVELLECSMEGVSS